MNVSRLPIYILAIVITFASCGKDEVAPEMTLSFPDNNGQYFFDEELTFSIDASDNEELAMLNWTILIDDMIFRNGTFPISGMAVEEELTIDPNFSTSTNFDLVIEIEDECGNQTSESRTFTYTDAAAGSVDLSFKLRYNGAPLVMFDDYEYPDGRMIEFTRFSMYLSDLSVGSSYAEDIAYLNLTNAHATAEMAEQGYTLSLPKVAPTTYTAVDFGVGVKEDLNATGPSDYPADHPLSRSGEHWFSWDSYVFLKVEANMDSNGDGIKDLPIALHIGSDAAYTFINTYKEGEVISNQTTQEEVTIDLFDFFGGSDTTYDIDATSSIHALSQSEAMLELTANYVECFE